MGVRLPLPEPIPHLRVGPIIDNPAGQMEAIPEAGSLYRATSRKSVRHRDRPSAFNWGYSGCQDVGRPSRHAQMEEVAPVRSWRGEGFGSLSR